MKRYLLKIAEKNAEYNISRIFVNAESKDKAEQYFQNNFSRFNILLDIIEWR